jgi:LEA14-like dessication related protein
MINHPIRTLLALSLCLWLAACSTLGLQKPQVSLVDIRPAASTLLEQNFTLTLRIQNPNHLPIKAAGLNFTLQVAGQQLASGASNQAIHVPALGDTQIQLQLHTSLVSWLKQLGKVVQGDGKLAYQLEGQLLGVQGLADLPFSSSGEWKLP